MTRLSWLTLAQKINENRYRKLIICELSSLWAVNKSYLIWEALGVWNGNTHSYLWTESII